MNLEAIRVRDELLQTIGKRWGILEWEKHYPWWRQPARVRILLYADSVVRFEGGSFLGLKYVTSLLQSRAYPFVRFEIASAHRDGSDPSASISGAKKLTDLDIVNKYDEIWFFGFASTPSLDAAEVALMASFMAAPKSGGVLVTGDHANLGRGIAGQLPRAGVMRQYPAPDNIGPGWNTTLEDGPDANSDFDFEDQSDDKPQTIRWRRYPLFSGLALSRRSRPHPVLCGPDGPIDVLPDHQHEGEALAPVPAPGDANWPTKAGHQERPEVIAWGSIKDPAASKHGQEIGLISAYDGHNVDVGRVLADSTWHHWFDINLTGALAPPSPYAGFDETAAGRAALKKIDAYFLNAGVWLAPPERQTEMRNFGWWSILWTDRVIELSPEAPLLYLGEQAMDALGKRAPRCTVSRWILDLIFKEKIPHWEWPQFMEKFRIIEPPIEQFAAGGMLRQLLLDHGAADGKRNLPKEAIADKLLERSLSAGLERGLRSLGDEFNNQLEVVSKLRSRGVM